MNEPAAETAGTILGGNATHIAAIRIVREGREAEFEAALKGFIQRSLDHGGTTGAQIIRPSPGSPEREYGILRTFTSESECEAFFASDLFREWQEEVAEFVEGEPITRRLHGLEAFFHNAGAPPKWKMAVLVWMGVFPSVTLWGAVMRPLLGNLLPGLLFSAILSAMVVCTLTWGVMPLLTRLFSKWLRSKPLVR
ncbi:MAG: antibiotic biosynthesis monooxygenase [Planctomycetota bacterium]